MSSYLDSYGLPALSPQTIFLRQSKESRQQDWKTRPSNPYRDRKQPSRPEGSGRYDSLGLFSASIKGLVPLALPWKEFDCALGKDLPGATAERMGPIPFRDEADDLSNSP